MKPHSLSHDWAVSRMRTILKYNDPEVLDAVLELLSGVGDFAGEKGDCLQAALDFGYRQTEDCEKHCQEYLGIAV